MFGATNRVPEYNPVRNVRGWQKDDGCCGDIPFISLSGRGGGNSLRPGDMAAGSCDKGFWMDSIFGPGSRNELLLSTTSDIFLHPEIKEKALNHRFSATSPR